MLTMTVIFVIAVNMIPIIIVVEALLLIAPLLRLPPKKLASLPRCMTDCRMSFET